MYGLSICSLELSGMEGLLVSALLLILSLIVLHILIRLLPLWPEQEEAAARVHAWRRAVGGISP